MWWHEDYFYRRHISVVTPPEPVPSGHVAVATLGNVLLDNNKTREDFEDIEVIFQPEEDIFYQLHREVQQDEDGIHVTFQVYRDIDKDTVVDGEYFIYYGNPDLLEVPDRMYPLLPSETLFPDETLYPADIIHPWPIGVAHNSSGIGGYGYITYTRPGEHWVDGESSTKGARASIMIYATSFRIISSVGRDKGIMEIQIDEGEWKSVDLFAEEFVEYKSVFEYTGLDPDTIHEIRIRVTGDSNTSAEDHKINIRGLEYAKPVKVFDLGEEVNEDVWSSYVGGA